MGEDGSVVIAGDSNGGKFEYPSTTCPALSNARRVGYATTTAAVETYSVLTETKVEITMAQVIFADLSARKRRCDDRCTGNSDGSEM